MPIEFIISILTVNVPVMIIFDWGGNVIEVFIFYKFNKWKSCWKKNFNQIVTILHIEKRTKKSDFFLISWCKTGCYTHGFKEFLGRSCAVFFALLFPYENVLSPNCLGFEVSKKRPIQEGSNFRVSTELNSLYILEYDPVFFTVDSRSLKLWI